MMKLCAATCGALALAGAALAQDTTEKTSAAPHVAVELNAAVDAASGGCTLSFLITNTHAAEITKAVFETVLFDAQGQVDRLTLFDFGALPPGRPRVRQFTLGGAGCEGFGRILFNGAATCESQGSASPLCTQGLRATTRTKIEVIG
ncbi:MAG: hypothetical protein ACSHWZ_01975 [Sulfitobacter sp.]